VPGEETVTPNGVKLIGLANYEGHVAKHASQVLAANFANMIEHFWDKEAKTFKIISPDDDPKGCLITHDAEPSCTNVLSEVWEQN
jgi:NAD(P) transhydrogenase subunit alpha